MTKLLENTYNAYNRFLEGELNQYDLISLIEDEIISGEVLESMLEEGFLSSVALGHHLNNASPSDTYKTNSLMQHNAKSPIVRHISDTNHTQNYLKQISQKHFKIMNPEITKNDIDKHKQEISNVSKTFEKTDKLIGKDNSREINDHLFNKYGEDLHKDIWHLMKNKHDLHELNKPLNRMKYHDTLNKFRNLTKDYKELSMKKYLEVKKENDNEELTKHEVKPKYYKGNAVRGGVINIDPHEYMAKKYNKEDNKSKNENKQDNESSKNYKETPLTKYINKKYKKSGDLTDDYIDNLSSDSKYDKEISKIENVSKNITKDINKSNDRGFMIDQKLSKDTNKSGTEYLDAIATGKHIENQLKDKNMPKEAREELEKLSKKHNEYLNNVRLKHLKNLKSMHDSINNGNNYKRTHNI